MVELLRVKKIQLTLVVILLVAFSWIGSLDRYSDEYTKTAIIQAAAA